MALGVSAVLLFSAVLDSGVDCCTVFSTATLLY